MAIIPILFSDFTEKPLSDKYIPVEKAPTPMAASIHAKSLPVPINILSTYQGIMTKIGVKTTLMNKKLKSIFLINGYFFKTIIGPTSSPLCVSDILLFFNLTLVCMMAAIKKLTQLIKTKILISKTFKRIIEHAAPNIFEIEKLVSKRAFKAGTFSSSTKEGGSERIAGLKILEPIPTKKEAMKSATKNMKLFSGIKNKSPNNTNNTIALKYSVAITVLSVPNLLIIFVE